MLQYQQWEFQDTNSTWLHLAMVSKVYQAFNRQHTVIWSKHDLTKLNGGFDIIAFPKFRKWLIVNYLGTYDNVLVLKKKYLYLDSL